MSLQVPQKHMPQKRKSEDHLQAQIEARARDVAVKKERANQETMQTQFEARANDVKVEKDWANQKKHLLSFRQPKPHYVVTPTRQRKHLVAGKHYCCNCGTDRRVDDGSSGGRCVECRHYRCVECLLSDQRHSEGDDTQGR
jgi:hypothetical protein